MKAHIYTIRIPPTLDESTYDELVLGTSIEAFGAMCFYGKDEHGQWNVFPNAYEPCRLVHKRLGPQLIVHVLVGDVPAYWDIIYAVRTYVDLLREAAHVANTRAPA